jgi:hypothetical protein
VVGLAWYAMELHGVVCYGVMWYGMIWCGVYMVYCGILYHEGLVWYRMVCIWFSMILCRTWNLCTDNEELHDLLWIGQVVRGMIWKSESIHGVHCAVTPCSALYLSCQRSADRGGGGGHFQRSYCSAACNTAICEAKCQQVAAILHTV